MTRRKTKTAPEAETTVEAEATVEAGAVEGKTQDELLAMIQEIQAELEAEQAKSAELEGEVVLLTGLRASEMADRFAKGLHCINCGQTTEAILIYAPDPDAPDFPDVQVYECPLCKHRWTDEQEQAPFRRLKEFSP